MNGNGEIDYSEWLVATSDLQTVLSMERLNQAFQFYDKGKKGKLGLEQIKEAMGKDQNLDEGVWNDIMAEVDEQGKGEVGLDQFKRVMRRLLSEGGQE
mmetsp:Transcript_16285/g.27532  ORF Transcript_16285/g.27532 Transcript_16285/m.27532 type:complete len:98 (-) Transcript_16285:6-299(-)